MQLYVDIPAALMRRAQALLARGDYASLNELVVVAVENQLTAEAEEPEAPAAPVAGALADLPGPLASLRFTERTGRIDTLPSPGADRLLWPGADTEDDLYLWGQINRILPIKVGLRVLLRMAAEQGDVQVDRFRQAACLEARSAGMWIRDVERQRGVGRNDAHWTALPVGGSTDKSLARYRQHFLVHARADGVLDGGLARLKLASLAPGNRLVRPTPFGLAWGALENPVLDRADLSGPSLSAEEAAAYIEHVVGEVPEERNPLSETVHLIAGGQDNNERLDAALSETHGDWTSNMVVTMRAGNIGRLMDLGAVVKTGYGSTATFALSEIGRRLASHGTIRSTRGEQG